MLANMFFLNNSLRVLRIRFKQVCAATATISVKLVYMLTNIIRGGVGSGSVVIGRVLDFKSRGLLFEPHERHWDVYCTNYSDLQEVIGTAAL